MYELVQVAPRTYYMQSPAKIGVVELGAGEVCFIDSGSDKDAVRKARQILDAHAWRLRAIYNTHSNADHIGGNSYLASQTGCKIYAHGIERDFTRHTILEPSFLYGGFPPEELKRKFLLAQESDAEELTEDILPEGLYMIPLPGHFFDMVGFRTPDDIVFLADCLSSEATLEKYKITFIYDVASYLDTLEKVKAMQAKLFIPSHADASENIAPLAELNIKKVNEVARKIVSLCAEPICFERILQRLFSDFGLTMTFEQHALVGSTVRSYLSYLKKIGEVDATFEDNILLWRKK